jgi:hypothetical protein
MNFKLDTSAIRSQLRKFKSHFWAKQIEEIPAQERATHKVGAGSETSIQVRTTKMDIQNEIIQETTSSSVNLLRQSEYENQIKNNEKYFCIKKTSIVVGILFLINLLNYIDRFTVAGTLNTLIFLKIV